MLFHSTTPSQFKSPPPVRASLCAHPAHLTRRRFQKLCPPAWDCSLRAILNAGWPALLAALSCFLTTNLSDPLFGDVLGAI
jgi:hypothetical protein